MEKTNRNKVDAIDLEPHHLAMVRSTLAEHMPYAVVWAYGSRVKWNANERSDLDMVAFSITENQCMQVREAFTESEIPFIVQIFSWEMLQEDFQENIKEQYYILQDENSWRKCTLGEVVEVIGGGTPKTSIPEYWGGDIPWITPRDLTGYTHMYISCGERNITKLGLKESSAQLLPKGSVLLTSRAPIGYIALSENDISTNQGFKSLVSDGIKTYNIFLYYWLKANIEYLKSNGSGTTFSEISGSVVKQLQILLPPLSEQKAIAEVLSSLDDKIDLLHRQNKTLESMAETLFREYFIENAKEDWEEGKLGDIISVIESGSRPKGGIDPDLTSGIASVGAESIKGIGNFNFSDTKFINRDFFDKMKKGKVCDKDVLIYKDGAYIGRKGLFGCNFPFKEFAINEHVFILRANELASQYFLYFALNEEELRTLNTNSAQPGLNQASMKSFEITIPQKEIIEKFDREVESLVDKILYNAQQIQTLEQLRDTLLPKLINGIVRVRG